MPSSTRATAYAIFRNDEFEGIATSNTYDITISSSDDVLTIRSANSRGGFGEAATVDNSATGLQKVTTMQENTVYNMQGIRVDKAHKGLYIKNGKKVVVY